VVLVGNPQVWQKENNLKGERIIFNLKDNTMRAESSPQKRVEANLYPAKQPGAGGQEAAPLPAKPRKDRSSASDPQKSSTGTGLQTAARS
jgi:BRCT domain type II-containing protein